jgi:DNA-binding beta-propeller fold protein YncE
MRGLFVIALLIVLVSAAGSLEQPAAPLRLIQAIPLDGVEGRIDHMAADPDGQWLFIAALGSNTVEVVDLRAGKRIRSLGGFREPQGVWSVPLLNRLFVANARDGICEMLDGTSFRRLRSVRYSDDADNVRCDATAKRIYVGYGGGALGVLDARSGDSLESIPLKAHPESFQLEAAGARIFVNIPDASEIAVVDRSTARVVAEWRCGDHAANFPMALDEAGHRLFVGCRHPAAALVYDTRSGKRTAAVPINGDTDDIFYDAACGRVYVSCGAGSLDVLARTKSGGFERIASIPTARGARTSLYVPALGRLYLAVPHRGTQRAELRVFEAVR